MRIVFLGNDPWSVPSLAAVAGSSHDVAAVLTRVPRPAGRGGEPRPTPVAEAARALALPLEEVDTVKAGPGREALVRAAPDVMVVVAYGEILPGDVLGVPGVGPVNVHFSLLPALRGANPVARAILEGRPVTGVTTMRMDEGMDTGPILLQREEPILDRDDAGSLGARLAELGGRLLVETLDGLADGTVGERPQEEEGASMAPRFTTDDEWLDWSEPAQQVWRRVRALAPEPGARTRFRGRTLKVVRAHPRSDEGEAGAVLEDRRDLVVAAGRGALVLDEVIPEGRRRMAGGDFIRGQRPEPGERLG